MNSRHPISECSRIAVIGSGISGLAAACILSSRHEVTLYEADTRLGGHTHTHTVPRSDGTYAVDSGFIVYNGHTYPNLIRLLAHFGIRGQPAPMSFSVRNEMTDFEFKASNLDTLFSQRSNILNPALYKLITEIFRFRKESAELLSETSSRITLGEYLKKHKYSEFFVSHFIIPMGAAIWSSSVHFMMDFPASFFIRFFDNHGFLKTADQPQWFTIPGGSASYIPHLVKPLDNRIRKGTPVRMVQRFEDRVEILTDTDEPMTFDYAVMAVHADQAVRMLNPLTDVERTTLSAFQYQPNRTILHTDRSLMPQRKKTWASWNYHITRYPDEPVGVSYNMNILQSIRSADDLIVTLNRHHGIEPSAIIDSQMYAHPVFSLASMDAQNQFGQINGNLRTFFCGAYWRYGFHEDGLLSALMTTRLFGLDLDNLP